MIYDIVELGGIRNIPVFKLAITPERDSYEQSVIAVRGDSIVLRTLIALASHETAFIDVGANIGTILLPLAKKVQIAIGFEPITTNIARLLLGAKESGLSNVCVFPFVASDTDDVTGIVESGASNTGSYVSSLSASKVMGIRLDTLYDTFFAKLIPDHNRLILKVDVEGFEPNVFRGAVNLIKARRPIIAFESIVIEGNEDSVGNMKEVKSQLEDSEYMLFQLIGGQFYATQSEAAQYHHVADYFALPSEFVPDAPSEFFSLNGPDEMLVIQTVQYLFTELKWHRMHANGLIKRLGLPLALCDVD